MVLGRVRESGAVALVVAICFAPTSRAQNLIENGDFTLEVPSNGFGNGWTSFAIDSGGGWRDSNGHPGGQFILNDSGQPDSDPTITQTVPGVSALSRYRLSGECILHYAISYDENSPAFGVAVDGVLLFELTYAQSSGDWMPFSVEFLALGPEAEVLIAAERNGNDVSFAVDNIELVELCRTADLTGDGTVDTLDFLLFLGAWSVGNPLADWNEDGTIDTLDFLAYLNAWVAGC